MEVDQLIDVLVRSTDQNLRDRAEQQLVEAENANLVREGQAPCQAVARGTYRSH